MNEKEFERIERRVNALVCLLIRQQVTIDKDFTLKAQIEFLNSLHFPPIEIAEILGKTQNHINKELANIRKSRR